MSILTSSVGPNPDILTSPFGGQPHPAATALGLSPTAPAYLLFVCAALWEMLLEHASSTPRAKFIHTYQHQDTVSLNDLE